MYLAGLGAYYFKNGQAASVLYVGDVMTFNVPGYSKVWLDQKQNGTPQYSGPIDLPMPAYQLLPRDVGTFTASVYQLNAGGQKGQLIGTDSIQVQAYIVPGMPTQTVQQTIYAPPTIQQTAAPTYQNQPTGGGTVSTGIPTPSAPPPNPFQPTLITSAPSGPIDLSAPIDPGMNFKPQDCQMAAQILASPQGPTWWAGLTQTQKDYLSTNCPNLVTPDKGGTQQAGFEGLPMLLLAGLGLYILFGGSK